ncbi:flagellar basal-body MS-ring/collar protein FliF [Paenibacillus sp. NPDC058071]|uniref:flagellar basal-body MS-ring/collar protein FliF n=1 Tax=Paenibacillus sp. NPDC058071 TaxID=3346326 RepID=UPI0036DF19A2
MNEKIAQSSQRLKQFWGQMGRKQKIGLGASIGVLLLSIILLTYIFTRTDYELAFQNLDSTDAAAIVNYLEGSGISYELSPNGKSISVPSAVATRIKLEVGSQGLVKNGSMGFEAFSKGSSAFGSTENEFNVKYLNALNGEIQQLLNGMQGVESTKVLVNLPEESVFLSPVDKEKASASIMMNFLSGYRPSQKEIDGYYNLVKTAVPKLALEDITITSPQGEFSSSQAGGQAGMGTTEAAETQFQIQRKYEAELRKSIQSFLGPIVGDNLVISVASSFNFDKKKSEEQLVKPLDNNNNNGIIISEQVDTSSSTNNGSGGVAGTGDTDVPGYTAGQGGSGESENSSRVTNYEPSRINNLIESGPYTIKDLSVSIGIDQDKLDQNGIDNVKAYLASLVRAQLADSGQDVNDDVLIDKKVSIITQTFAANGGAAQSNGFLSTGWMIGIGAAALAIIAALSIMLVRRRKQRQAVEEQFAMEPPANVEYPSLDLDITNDSQARKNLETLAKRKPEEFVNLLRTWLAEE